MKLLILTQAVDENNPVLGFFLDWIKEFANHCESIIVICLFKGKYDLPDNIKVLSLGKEDGASRIKYLFRFYKYIWQERNNYDAVFVHMNPIYVVLGGWLWKLWRKKIGFWYAHGHVSFSLRVAEKLVDIIFTSTSSGFRLKSNKINVVGQGIDIKKFLPDENKKINDNFKIISIGRISPSKDYETLINAIEIVVKDKKTKNIEVSIIGEPGTPEQKKYFENLKKLVVEKRMDSVVHFLGAIANKKITPHLQEADLFVNTSHTGSLDKTILEAMSCELVILSCNESLEEVLDEEKKQLLMFERENFNQLAERIMIFYLMGSEGRGKTGSDLRKNVEKNHALPSLIGKILNLY
jgi:glycosyltransferase involved in cell wall biosynthesis